MSLYWPVNGKIEHESSSEIDCFLSIPYWRSSFWKHAYSNTLKISPQKTESFQIQILIFYYYYYYFHISAQNVHCGYSLEPPWRGGPNEYPQSMFLNRNTKNNVYPCKPVYYKKWGLRGSKLYRYVFRDVYLSEQTLTLPHPSSWNELFRPLIWLCPYSNLRVLVSNQKQNGNQCRSWCDEKARDEPSHLDLLCLHGDLFGLQGWRVNSRTKVEMTKMATYKPGS